MNKLIITGRLTNEGTYAKRTVGGQEVAVYNNTVAVNTRKADGTETTQYFDFGTWRGLADVCKKYCRKGMKVALEGSVALKSYINNNGQYVARLQVQNVQNIEFCDKYGIEENTTVDAPVEEETPVATTPAASTPVETEIADDDDLPF